MTNLMNEPFSRNGLFSLPSGKEMHGTLTVDGSDSVLDLWSSVAADQYSRRKPSESQTTTIIGTLDDQKKVSLVDCMELGRTTFGGSDGYSYHTMSGSFPIMPSSVTLPSMERSPVFLL